MNKFKAKNYCLSIWIYIIRNHIHWCILITLLLAFMLVEYEGFFLTWYNKDVMPIVSQFHSDIFMWFAALIAIIMCGILQCRFKNEYVYDSRIVYVVFVICTLIGRYRVSNMLKLANKNPAIFGK